IEIAVCDTGVGMAAADIPKAMAPFGQIDNVMTRRHEGTGLGLPLTKHLVELHGGSLEIESAPGAGTTVRIRLPRSETAENPPAVNPESNTRRPPVSRRQ
ncbi:MAG TPA: ATP-binding protein, partial [Alphaproteobacteria bacterium]|nr:ATP-binding protein [Alphaproteobacteria bacterium]